MTAIDMRAALLLLRRVEEQSHELCRLDVDPGACRVEGSWAVRSDWNPPVPLAVRPPVTSATVDPSLPRVRADAVFIGRESAGLLRLRAFYLSAGVTVAVHGRLPLGQRSRLLTGASVMDRARGTVALVVPTVRERGRRLRHCWLVEELLGGERFSPAAWAVAAPSLADRLAGVWLRGPATGVPMDTVLPPATVDAFDAMLTDEDPDRGRVERLRKRVRSLARGRYHVAVGWCHGDPGHGNWIRLCDGRPALVDWELARRRPAGHDAMKLLVGLSDPLPVIETTAARIERSVGPRSAPWRLQVAACLARWLAGWRRDREVAERGGAIRAYHRRLRQRLDLLEVLTA